MTETVIHLRPELFGERERALLEHPPFTASAFRYDSGVAALRLKNESGEVVMLPFQGQQIWSARFGGRELTMKSMFDEPKVTQAYLETYGGFLIHCGVTAMGAPGAGDTHPLHGELPNAPYQQAYLFLGEDERGAYLGLGGRYQHTVAFSSNYVAEPRVKLYADSRLLSASLTVTNLKATPMELMYLAHINFRPVDNGRLVYSAHQDPEHVRVRKSVPAHVTPAPGYAEFLDELARRPEQHHVLAPGLAFDPEVVFFIDYLADADGWAHTLQVHPDGAADYVRHRPAQLDTGVRWICRTPDQDALGMIDPATAEPEGYSAEKAKGNLKTLTPGGTWRCEYDMGALNALEAADLEKTIDRIIRGDNRA
ncbi:aldose 1-epimerase family protein [soil metagenome]